MDLRKAPAEKAGVEKPSSADVREGGSPKAAASARAQSADVRAAAESHDSATEGRAASPAVPSVQLHLQTSATLQAEELRSSVGAQRVKEKAAEGLSGQAQELPHLKQIQKSFGSHDVGSVKAHVGGAAEKATGDIGAVAYTSGDKVAFKGSPDLRTAAHEAAHVVQQRGGVQLKDGVGQVGDSYEKHADAVAARVVAGKSAEDLLTSAAKPTAKPLDSTQMLVQRLGFSLDQPLPEGAPTPEHLGGRGATTQRRYSVKQYITMWEEARGRKMTDDEKKTLARGCIGIVALNLEAVNPPLDHAYATFEQAMAVVDTWNQFIKENQGMELANGLKVGDYQAYMFAKLFWSNQREYDHSLSPGENRRLSRIPDDKTFMPDPDTGRVDMSKYYYRGQPKALEDLTEEEIREGKTYYINFDYGFWDESSQCFWHANHCEPGMKVYQSTREKFARGYIDFDKIVYCAAIAKKFNFETAARTHI